MEKVYEYLEKVDEVIARGRFKDNWASLLQHRVPSWYRDGKFGIFIHYGVYTVPAFDSEWYPRHMYLEGHKVFEHHVKTYGEHKKFGYKDFIPMFKAEKYKAEEWAQLFEDAGARFVMPVAEHHDGFQMYDSDLSENCAAKMGPKKDIVGQLKTAVEGKGMVFAASSHRIEHYFFMSGGRHFDSDIVDPKYGDLYWPSVDAPSDGHHVVDGVSIDKEFMDEWLALTCELIDKYRPKLLFFDWWIQIECMKPYLKKFAAYYYNRADEWGEEVTINYKFDAFMKGTAVNDIERGQLSDVSPDFWQCDTSVAKNSWSYTIGNDYKMPVDLICDLVDVVSKNGALLLNIGPKADGSIPDEDKHILQEVGKWLKINGEGIYDTVYWKKYGEGPTKTPEGHFTDTQRLSYTDQDFRFTAKGEDLYAFSMAWPEDGVVRIRSLGTANQHTSVYSGLVKSAEILGYKGKIKTIRAKDHLSIIAPDLKNKNNYPVCIKIRLG